ncbi:XRE family transcriptional regulator [Streptomyces sp. ISL-98]|uniref:helix-turn-helix domain-containing protein n=1 Tax=Streptomyces sp. ISL-98 TaxID=2819192 RepID=UPI001BE89D80|nr:helix-turn-helix domain-containing protein [Streptomyces sp. ISL-98]MBT2510285.1 XRE family transcriptional regulator [Streptomyces sp. ISL-98]
MPEYLLARADVRAAISRHDFGTFFALARQWAGISFMRIADACDIKPERVGKLARGEGRVTSVEKMEQIADGLRIPGELMRLAPRPWEARNPRELPDARSAEQSMPSVSKTPDMTAMDSFRMADRQLGGGHLYSSVLHYLHNNMAPRIFGSESGDDAPQMFRAAASLTEMAGWMAHDSGRNGRAREHFAKALPLATAGEDRAVGANILASMSHLALQTGRLGEAVSLARAGRDHVAHGTAVPTLSARLHAMEARALAQLGEPDATRRALALAQKELARSPDAPPSYWISSFDAAALASETALSLQDLGTLPAAVDAAERAVALRSGDRARSRVFGQITLATIRTQQGELEAACDVGRELLSACGTLGSVRITQQLDELASALAPYRGERVVAEFLDCLGAVNQQRALLLAGISTPHSGGAIT